MSWREELPVVTFLSGLTFGVGILTTLLLPAVSARGGPMGGFGWTGPIAEVAIDTVPRLGAVPVYVLVSVAVYLAIHNILIADRLSVRTVVGVVAPSLAAVVCLWMAQAELFTGNSVGTVLTAGVVAFLGGALTARRGAANAFPGPTGTVLLLTVVLVAGVVVGSVGGFAFDDSFVANAEEIPPHTEWEADYRWADEAAGIMSVTHAGGDPVPADQLKIGSYHPRAAEEAMQNRSGPWAGEATGGSPGERLVTEGDKVTVGVQSDCFVRVYYEGTPSELMAVFSCAEVREESTPNNG